MDANLLHISYEGGILEDPDYEPEESMWRITCRPRSAPTRRVRRARVREGDIVAVERQRLSPARC
jgi:argininosuccinate synthase